MSVKEKNLFLYLCIASTVAFLLCGYSLIQCFAFEGEGIELGSHVLEISYLFLHLILCAIIFYLSFRAMKFSSFFIKNVMFDENGYPSKGKWITVGVFFAISLAIFVYSLWQTITMNLPLANELGKIVWHDIMNATCVISFLLSAFLIYPTFPYNKSNKNAE